MRQSDGRKKSVSNGRYTGRPENQMEARMDNGKARTEAQPANLEERAIVNEIVVPIVAGGVGGAIGGAANALMSNHLAKPAEQSPPPPPKVELPPGVDGD